MVITGLDSFCQNPPRVMPANWGLLCNPASVTAKLQAAPEALSARFPGRIKALFGPQHGFFAQRQDNMVESGDARHPLSGLPIYSLYGRVRRPTPAMLQGLDLLLVDLPDMGCRVYTFFATLIACMEEAARQGVALWVLDRPNPLGRGEDEGPILPPELMSFVGPYPMPLRHSLTLGELAQLVKAEKKLDLDLRVFKARNWRGQNFSRTGLPWVIPSPNLPVPDSAYVYPGQALLEGTSLSEGRGTTRPFEIFGAPGLDPWGLIAELKRGQPQALAGVWLRPLYFEPTFHKYAGQVCAGLQIHVLDQPRFRPLRLTLALLAALSRIQPGLWSLRPPPYEYEYQKRPLDLLLGSPRATDGLLAGAWPEESVWERELAEWRRRTQPYLLYGRSGAI